MGLLQSIIDNTPDRHLVEANERYQVSVMKATFGSTKGAEETDEQEGRAKRPVLLLSLKIEGDPIAYPVFERLFFPIKGDKDSSVQFMQETIKAAMRCLGYNAERNGEVPAWKPDMAEVELPLMKGLTGWVIMKIEEDMQGIPHNQVKTWLLPSEDK